MAINEKTTGYTHEKFRKHPRIKAFMKIITHGKNSQPFSQECLFQGAFLGMLTRLSVLHLITKIVKIYNFIHRNNYIVTILPLVFFS